ncbi:MAG: hypothetical protein MR629_02330 [Helicobacter sp.]|nr:hypothetical protein [Helicobacter sp.]
MRQVFLFLFLITFSNASSQEENHEDFSEVSGYIGSFVKSSSLGANKDSYGTLNFSGILSHKPHKDVVLSLGVFGALALLSDPKENIKDYSRASYVNNKGFLHYQSNNFSAQLGRFESNLDWLGEHIQGSLLDYKQDLTQSTNLRIYAAYANEQAHINREEQSNFEEFQKEYNSKDMIVIGVQIGNKTSSIGLYEYHFVDIFNTAGANIYLQIPFSLAWSLQALSHFAYSHSLMPLLRAPENAFFHGEKDIGHTYLGFVRISMHYKESFITGLGWVKIGEKDFINAYLGNKFVFEADDHTPFLFNVIAPGGWHNGSNATNMFYGQTESFYGFGAFKLENLSFNLHIRQSNGIKIRTHGGKQTQISVGVGFMTSNSWNLGAVAVYMRQERRTSANSINSSYFKTFIEYAF